MFTYSYDKIKKVIVESSENKARYCCKYFLYFCIFVLVSFSRAASIAVIFLLLSHNALFVYLIAFIVIKVVIDIAQIICKFKVLEKIRNEALGDIAGSVFNILDT